MHPITQKLLRLNHAEGFLQAGWPPGAQAALAENAAALRREIEPTLLAQFDRLRAAGKEAVTPVIDGACQGCGVKLSLAVRSALEYMSGVHQCESCGRFIFLGPSSPPKTGIGAGHGVEDGELAAANPPAANEPTPRL